MTFLIPRQPNILTLTVDRLWNGDVCPDEHVWAVLELSAEQTGLRVKVESPILSEQKIPLDVPVGSRVDELWNFDVVELFLVGPGHRYFELELGAGGHFLALSFDRIRHRSNEHKTFEPIINHHKTETNWVSELIIPWTLIPENIRALNTFVYAAGQFLSMSPLPGDKPDFHQPDFYPAAQMS